MGASRTGTSQGPAEGPAVVGPPSVADHGGAVRAAGHTVTTRIADLDPSRQVECLPGEAAEQDGAATAAALEVDASHAALTRSPAAPDEELLDQRPSSGGVARNDQLDPAGT